MDRLLSYLSFRGRANRARFWLTNLALWGVLLGMVLVGRILAAVPLLGIVAVLLGIVAYLALLVASVANAARRLHDRAKSAWWLLVFVGIPFLLSIPSELMNSGGGSAGAQAGSALFALLALPFSIWGFVVMGCLKGTVGPNKYGDDPLQALTEEAVA
jgi:uncharacterized membrane protein YhaH (DUF805 family)